MVGGSVLFGLIRGIAKAFLTDFSLRHHKSAGPIQKDFVNYPKQLQRSSNSSVHPLSFFPRGAVFWLWAVWANLSEKLAGISQEHYAKIE
jgi:hypothetical protein